MNLKKILALVLVFAMCLSMVPTYAFAEDEGIELVEEEPEAIVEVVDEPEEEPSTEPEEEETPQEPVEEEVPEEPAPTEEEPEEEPEEEEEEEELVLTSEGVKDDETFKEQFVPRVRVVHVAGGEDSWFNSLTKAVEDYSTQPGDTVILATDTTMDHEKDSEGHDAGPIEKNPITIGKYLKIDGQGFKINQKISTGYNVEFFNVTFTDASIDVNTGSALTDPAVSIAGGNVKATFTDVTFGVDAELRVNNTDAGSVTLENVAMLRTGENIIASANTEISITGEYGVFSGRFYADAAGSTFAGNMSITGGTFYQPILKKWIAFGFDTDSYSSTYQYKDYCTGTVKQATAEAAIWTAKLINESGEQGNGGWRFFDDANAALAAGFGTYSGKDAAKPVAFINTPATITYQMPIYKGEQTGYLEIYVNDKMPQDLVIPSEAQSDGYFVSLATHTGLDPIEHQPVETPENSPFPRMFVLTSFRYAAMIGDTGYDSLKAAYAEYQADDTIELFRKPTPTELVELANNASVKIKTNGFDVVVDDGSGTTPDPTIKAINSAYRVTVAEDKTTGVNTYTALPATFVRESNSVTYQYATFKDALAAATATDTIRPIPNTGAKIDEEVTIDKDVTIQSVENTPVIITAPVTIEATVIVSGTVEMSNNACFEIAKGVLNANAPGVFEVTGVDHFATLASRTSLNIGCTVNLSGLKGSAIVADDPATVSITGTVVAGEDAIPATASLFNGGKYTIEGSNPNANVIVAPAAGAFGFENADVDIIGGTVAVTGVKEGTVTVDARYSTVTLPEAPRTVFALGDEDYVLVKNFESWGRTLTLNTNGLVACRLDKGEGTEFKNQKLFPSFKAAASGAVYTGNNANEGNVITLIAVPEEGDVLQFTDANQKLVVTATDVNVNYENLAVAYSDEEHGDQLYYYVKAEPGEGAFVDCTVISQVRATAIIRNKDTKEYVKGYGSFAEAATPTDYNPATQDILIRNKDDSQVFLTKELNEIFVVCEAGASVVAPTTTLPAHRVLDLEVEGYTHHYVLADEHVQITWNAGNGFWFDGDGLPEKDPETGKIVTTKNTIGTQSDLITEFVADPFSNDDTLAFVGWTVAGETMPVDFDTYELPSDTNVLTLNATYEQAKVTMLDKGDYVHNFATVEAAYKFKGSNTDIIDEGTYPEVLQNVVLYVDDDVFYDPDTHAYKYVYVINKNGATIDARMNHQNPDVATATSTDIDRFWVVTCTDLGDSLMRYETAFMYAATVESQDWTSSKKNTGEWSEPQPATEIQTEFFDTLADAIEAGIADPYVEEGKLRTETRKCVFVPAYTEETYELADSALQGTKPVSERVLFVTYSASAEKNPITRAIGSTWTYSESIDPQDPDLKTRQFWLPTVTVTFETANTDLATDTQVIEKLEPVESSMSIASPTKLPEIEGHTFQFFCTDTNAPGTSKVVFVDGQYTVYATEDENTHLPTDTDLTIYAYYTPNQYTVTLAYFDEVKQEIATSTTLTGQYKDDVDITTVTDLLLPKDRQLDFWATPSNLSVEAATPTKLTENATFYALIKPQITFVGIADGVATGTEISPITQSRGTAIDAEDFRTAERTVFGDTGRVFDYWSLASRTDAEKTATPTIMPNADTTYYAIAKPVITVTVASWIDDHVATSTDFSGNRDEDAKIDYNEQAVSLFDGTGRVFDYWSLSTGTDKAPVTPTDIYETDVTYYAIAKPWVTITLSSWIDDHVATSTDFSDNRDEDVNFKYEEQAESLFKDTGRVFDYWSLSTGTDKAPVTPTDTYETDVTYYAIAKPRVTITLQAVVDKDLASSTTLVENRDEEKNVSVAFEKSEKDLFTDGRVFDYWATGTDVSNLTKVSTPSVLKFEEDVTYYAVAKPVITVTLSSWIDPEVATSTSWRENRDVTADGDEVVKFFKDAQTALFDGTERKFHHWATSTDVDAEQIATPTKLTFDEDQTYYAIPAPVFTLTLKYGEKTEKIVGDKDYPVDKDKVASATDKLFEGTGDKFAKFYTDEKGSRTDLPETYTADLTLLPAAEPKVEVTFDAGSGVFKDPVTGKNTNTSTTETNRTDPVDAKYQQLWDASKPSRAHYTFDGWLDEEGASIDAKHEFATSTTLTADWSGERVYITFYDSYSKTSILSDPQYYGDDLKKPTVEQVKETVGSRTGYTFFSDDLWEEDLVSPIAGNKTYNLKWYQVLSSVPCIVAEPDKQTQVYEFQNKAAVGRPLAKPDELKNVKRDGKIANWLINGDPERYFQFTDEDLVPEDLEFFLATFTDAPVPTPTDLFTVTWATDDGVKILEIDEDVLYGSKPDFNGVVPTKTNTADEFYYFDGWTIFGKGTHVYTEDELPAVTEDVEFHAHFTAVRHAESGLRSLSLGDSIAIKWRLNPDSIDSHAVMSLYRAEYKFKNGEDVETTGTITGEDLLVARPIAYCAAKEMTLPVTVTLFYDDVEIAEFEYTVRDYCLDGLKRDLGDKWNNLFAATLYYGAGAQTFKGFKTDDLANAGVTRPTVQPVPNATVTKSTGVTFNLITEAETLLQVKFATGGKDISDFTFKVGTKDVTSTVFVENNKFVVNIGGIPARQLDQNVTVTMTPKADGEILRFLGSPVGYMKTAVDKGSATLRDFMEAMYNYHYYAQQAQGAN